MILRRKLVIANLVSLVLPLLIYIIVVYAHVFDNAVTTLIYLAHIIIPFLLFIGLFRQDSLMLGCSSRMVFWRTVAACVIWAVAVGSESKYSGIINTNVIPPLVTKIFGEDVLPPLIPEMNYLLPMYEPIYMGLIFIYCTCFLNLAIVLGHCRKVSRIKGKE